MSRNRSLRYQDHVNLIRKKATMYYARLQAAQIMGVEFDDVMGELGVAFTKAAAGYNPESEYAFTTYLGTCMQNHFNKFATKLMLEQFGQDRAFDPENGETWGARGLGYISIEEATAMDEEGNSMGYASFEDDATPNPERVLDAMQRLAEIVHDDTLLPETRVYIGLLANPGKTTTNLVRERVKAKSAEIRKEVEERWGVTLPPLVL